jgi:hypothetical protein
VVNQKGIAKGAPSQMLHKADRITVGLFASYLPIAGEAAFRPCSSGFQLQLSLDFGWTFVAMANCRAPIFFPS